MSKQRSDQFPRTGSDRLLDALRTAGPAGMTRRKIHGVFSRRRSAARIREALNILLESGQARFEMVRTGGRPAERWYCTDVLSTNRIGEGVSRDASRCSDCRA